MREGRGRDRVPGRGSARYGWHQKPRGRSPEAREPPRRHDHRNGLRLPWADRHCARCHDHKFDPIQQKDYYRMQAAFAGVWHDERNWATPAEVDAYESAAEPLRRRGGRGQRSGSRRCARRGGAVEERRDAVLAGYLPSVEPEGAEETFEPVEAGLSA
ncbi:MAG: DUF1549 domain-containing protein [Bryobacterales bacterium]